MKLGKGFCPPAPPRGGLKKPKYDPCVKTISLASIPGPRGIDKRFYAIRDRYYFPVTEQEKMAQKLEEEKAEETKIREEHKSARRALKSEIQMRSIRPTIKLPGM